MRLQYAGYNLEDLSLTAPYEMEAVYNGPDYLYTTHRISVRGVLNPNSTSVNPAGNNVGGQFPAQTLQNMRGDLLQPRQTLIFAIGPTALGGRLVVRPASAIGEVPPNPPDTTIGFTVDANNGPMPLRCHVVNWIGFRTALVDFTIETYIRDNKLDGKAGPALLSHRWTMDQDIDEQFKSTRTINGTMVFRSDVRVAMGVSADTWRGIANFPVPPYWKREGVIVSLNDAGTQLKYEIDDKELYITPNPTNPAADIVQISATHTYQSHAGGPVSLVASALGGLPESFIRRGVEGAVTLQALRKILGKKKP